ncbi:MAG: MFS transporter [Acidimicrobiales bacterium]|nr:MFS transporter [Acidimicrobiales bacterium]MYG89718.1 MFS transporter [Acidimicrobiales bacterium]MYI27201.1 MFS transporter [Acidimicrobiales bacterium]
MRNEVEPGQVDLASVPQVPPAGTGVPQSPGAAAATGTSVIQRRDIETGQQNGLATAPRPASAVRSATAARPVPAADRQVPPAPPQVREAVSGRAWRALTVASLGTVLVGFNSTASNLALDSIRDSFAGATAADVGWGIAGFMIGTAAFLPLAGRLADRIGRKRIFQIGLALFALSAVFSAIAPTVWTLNMARVLQAISGAAVLPASLSLVLPLFPESRRTTAVGLWSASGPLAAAIAPQVSTLMLAAAGWRVLYFVSAPIAALLFVVGWRVLREQPTPPRHQRLDIVGATAGTVALLAIVTPLMQGKDWGLLSPVALALGGVGVVALAVFVFNSLRHQEPLLNLHLFRRRNVWVTQLANFLVGLSSQSLWLLWPLFLLNVWNYGVAAVGLALTLGPIAAGFSTITFSRLGERWNAVGFCRTGSAMQIASVGWMVLTLGTTPNYWFIMAPSIALFGLGWGMCVPLLNSVALKAVPEKYFGEVSGLFNTLRYASAAIGIAALFAVLTEDSGAASLVYYQRALVFFLIAASVGFMSLWIPLSRPGRSAS